MVSADKLDALFENMARVGALREIAKARSRIYQVDDKEKAARYFRRPVDSFYDLPYKQWARIRAWYYRKLYIACDAAHARGLIPCECPIFRETMGY